MGKSVTKERILPRNTKRLIFYICVTALPILQFLIFYIYVNFNSILLAFKAYTPNESDSLGYTVTFAGATNFVTALNFLKESVYMVKNSLLNFVFGSLLGLFLALVFSFYIYKKFPCSGFFKIILFMPQIISAVVFALLFKYIVTDVYMNVAKKLTGTDVKGLLDNPDTVLITVIMYNLWHGFGVNILLFSGAMSNINDSVTESAWLDGVNYFQEFFKIVLPMIFSTLKSFLVIAIVGVFTNQMQLVSLFGMSAGSVASLGYTLYVHAQGSDIVSLNASYLTYPELSALGLILTAVVFPLTVLIKKAMDKFGPSIS